MADQLNIQKVITQLKNIEAQAKATELEASAARKYLEQFTAPAPSGGLDFEAEARIIAMGNRRTNRLMKRARK